MWLESFFGRLREAEAEAFFGGSLLHGEQSE